MKNRRNLRVLRFFMVDFPQERIGLDRFIRASFARS